MTCGVAGHRWIRSRRGWRGAHQPRVGL